MCRRFLCVSRRPPLGGEPLRAIAPDYGVSHHSTRLRHLPSSQHSQRRSWRVRSTMSKANHTRLCCWRSNLVTDRPIKPDCGLHRCSGRRSKKHSGKNSESPMLRSRVPSVTAPSRYQPTLIPPRWRRTWAPASHRCRASVRATTPNDTSALLLAPLERLAN